MSTESLNWQDQRVVVTGGAGFLGRVVCAELEKRGAKEVLVPRSAQYDLTTTEGVRAMYDDMKPTVVLHLAAEVGGIGANRKRPGRFFYANMAMGMHLIEEARERGLERFVQVGTVCAYPKFAPVPFKESDLWNGYPEETNAPYGVAKKALFVMLDAYRAEYGFDGVVALPVNLYGPGDNFDLETSHVIPALINKFEAARVSGAPTVECWGTGKASREFLHVRDAAEGILRVAESARDSAPINLGTGHEVSIKDLSEMIAKIVGFEGDIVWNADYPDGQPRRQLDVSLAAEELDWKAEVALQEGLEETVRWWREQTQAGAKAA